jgi:hypothetical protein
MTISKNISDYIDVAIERERKIFNSDMGRQLEKSRLVFLNEIRVEREIWQDELKKVIEVVTDNTRRIVDLERFVR